MEASQSFEYSLTVKSVFLLAAKIKEDIAADDLEGGHPILEAREGTIHHLQPPFSFCSNALCILLVEISIKTV
jgi:hypothetical protein